MSNKVYPVTILQTSYIKDIVDELKCKYGSNLVHKTVYDRIEKTIDRHLSRVEKRIIQSHCGITKELVKKVILSLMKHKLKINEYNVFMVVKTKYVKMSREFGIKNKYTGLYYKLNELDKKTITDELLNYYKIHKSMIMKELIMDAVGELIRNDESVHITKIRLAIQNRIDRALDKEEREMITNYYIENHNDKK